MLDTVWCQWVNSRSKIAYQKKNEAVFEGMLGLFRWHHYLQLSQLDILLSIYPNMVNR